jgi:hypothetical protein
MNGKLLKSHAVKQSTITDLASHPRGNALAVIAYRSVTALSEPTAKDEPP